MLGITAVNITSSIGHIVTQYWVKQRILLRAREAQVPNTLTAEQWKAIRMAYGFKCAYCGKKVKLTMDHVTLISKGGGNISDNVIPACKPCNSRKGNRLPIKLPPIRLLL